MHPAIRVPEIADAMLWSKDDLLRGQSEANEQLVVAALRAEEEADTARRAQEAAEERARELKAREEELQATAEFRERLIGIIGHDLRNPLNTMLMVNGLLLARGELSDEDARLVTRSVTSGQRMTRMIGQLLEFTRARLGGGFQLELAAADLGEICRNIADELRIGSSAEVRVALDGDLTGNWDADRLSEVVSNIAGNAIDHAAPGTPVVIRAHEDGGAVVVEITNQGACIPRDLLPEIFNAFRRARAGSNPHADGGHLGLGLYISSEIVRSHGGTLEVRSIDETTTFTVRLPRVSTPPPRGVRGVASVR